MAAGSIIAGILEHPSLCVLVLAITVVLGVLQCAPDHGTSEPREEPGERSLAALVRELFLELGHLVSMKLVQSGHLVELKVELTELLLHLRQLLMQRDLSLRGLLLKGRRDEFGRRMTPGPHTSVKT
ncbi:hypothetical protein ACN28S_60745 [Cystobacter fuscus]